MNRVSNSETEKSHQTKHQQEITQESNHEDLCRLLNNRNDQPRKHCPGPGRPKWKQLLPADEEGITDARNAPPLAIAPFDAAQAKRHQRAWADYLTGTTRATTRLHPRPIQRGQAKARNACFAAGDGASFPAASTGSAARRLANHQSPIPAGIRLVFEWSARFLCPHQVRKSLWRLRPQIRRLRRRKR